MNAALGGIGAKDGPGIEGQPRLCNCISKSAQMLGKKQNRAGRLEGLGQTVVAFISKLLRGSGDATLGSKAVGRT